MTKTDVLILINIILTSLLFFKSKKDELIQNLVHPTKERLKTWTKKDKNKPKINDDSMAWRKENNLS